MMRCFWTTTTVLVVLVTCSGGARPRSGPAPLQTAGWIGGEWHPSNASNSLWWSPNFFDGYAQAVDRELGLTRRLGLSAVRVFLHNLAFEAGPDQFLANLEAFLAVAARHQLKVGLVFFDDCWNHAGASTQAQCQARPGVHNGCSMASPQDFQRTNTSRFERYVSEIIAAHRADVRVGWWEMFNEPHRPAAGGTRATPRGWSYQLRDAAYRWATALAPVSPVMSCWSGANNDSDVQDVHLYSTDWSQWTAAVEYGLRLGQGALFTEAGCRWYQGSSNAGSPLEVANWLQAMRASGRYVPGAMISWTVTVGNDNTRWHWGDQLGTPEPAIPWCGLMWPDGLPVSFTEANAIANLSGAHVAPSAVHPRMLYSETFLPADLDALIASGKDHTLAVSETIDANMSLSADQATHTLVEATIWPHELTSTSAVGVLIGGSAQSGLFGGVTGEGLAVIESWEGSNRTTLASFNLSALPANLPRTVDGWNMLRFRRSGNSLELWFNPTHADPAGIARGRRVSFQAKHGQLAAGEDSSVFLAIGGSAAMDVDYVGVFDGADLV